MPAKNKRDAIRAANNQVLNKPEENKSKKAPKKTTIVDDFIDSALKEEKSADIKEETTSVNSETKEEPPVIAVTNEVNKEKEQPSKPEIDLTDPEMSDLLKEQIRLMIKSGELKLPGGGRPSLYGKRNLISLRIPETLHEFAKEYGKEYGGVTGYIIHLLEEDKRKIESSKH